MNGNPSNIHPRARDDATFDLTIYTYVTHIKQPNLIYQNFLMSVVFYIVLISRLFKRFPILTNNQTHYLKNVFMLLLLLLK